MSQILTITYEFPPLVGGAGTFASELSTGLAELGHSVDLIAGKHSGSFSRKIFENIRLYRMKFFGKFFYIQLALIMWFSGKKNIFQDSDLIVLADLKAIIFSILFFNSDYRNKSIIVFHGSEINHLILNPSKWSRIFKLDNKFRKILPGYKKLFTVSEFLKNELLEAIPGAKINMGVLNHGINLSQFKPVSDIEKTDARKNLGISMDAKVFVSASRIVLEKGHDNLIFAFEQLKKTNKNIFLLIIGDGPNLQELRKTVSTLGLQDSVLFTGSVSRENIYQLFGSSDIFVLPTRIPNEGFGLVYIEANACGIPVIGSDIGGVTDAISNGINGILVDPHNIQSIKEAMNKFLDPEYRAKISKSALEYSLNHTHIQMAKQFYEQTLGNS